MQKKKITIKKIFINLSHYSDYSTNWIPSAVLTFDKRFHGVEMHPDDSIHKSMPRITQQWFIALVINLFLIGNKCVAAVSWTLYVMLNDWDWEYQSALSCCENTTQNFFSQLKRVKVIQNKLISLTTPMERVRAKIWWQHFTNEIIWSGGGGNPIYENV